MSGLRRKKHGKIALKIIKKEILHAVGQDENIIDTPQEYFNYVKLKIHMINCSFDSHIELSRDKLYDCIVKENIFCIYEPCIHAAVNIKFKLYETEDKIKHSTILVFQTGKIIITGASKKKEIEKTYQFITYFLRKHYNHIKK